MKINRRNVLIGLGTAAAGTGALFGTGALVSETVSRDISLTVEDSDGGAVQLPIEPVGDTGGRVSLEENDNEVDVLEVDVTSLPEDATVRIGEFDNDDTLERGVATIQNDNALDEPINLTIDLDIDVDSDLDEFEFIVAKSDAQGEDLSDVTPLSSTGEHEVTDLVHGSFVTFGIYLETNNTFSEVNGTITITAEKA